MEAKAIMTERSFNLVVPLAHEATDIFGQNSALTAACLTTNCAREYSAPVTETKVPGFDSPTGAALSRVTSGFFASGVALWAGRTGSRKARRCSTGLSTRSVPLTPFDSGRRFVQRTGATALQAHSLSVRESRTIQRAMRILETILRSESETAIANPSAVRDYLRTKIGHSHREEFVALWLNNQNRLIGTETLFVGTLSSCAVYSREVVRGAINSNAAAVIFAHNHPGGAAEPSQADISLTHALRTALAVVDVRVLDHFIVTGSKAISMAEIGAIRHG